MSERQLRVSLDLERYTERNGTVYAGGSKPLLTIEAAENAAAYVETETESEVVTDEVGEFYEREFDEGMYTVLPYCTDSKGNVMYAEGFPVTFVYDDTPPSDITFELIADGEIKESGSREDYRLFSARSVTIRVRAEDELSGISQLCLDSGAGMEDSDSVVVNEGGLRQVRAFCTDLCGNESGVYICDLRLLVDRRAPELTVKGKESDDGVIFDIELADDASGLGSVTVLWNDEVIRQEDYHPERIKTDEEELTVEIKKEEAEFGENELKVIAEDFAGNDASVIAKVKRHDDTPPRISIAGVTDGMLTAGPVAPGIDIDDAAIDPDSIEIYAVRSSVTGGETYRFSKNDAIVFFDDGSYELTVLAADKAGNEAAEKRSFTIDSSAPVINGLSKYDGRKLERFSVASEMGDMFTDDTLVQYHLYLNGRDFSEYEEVSEPGEYVIEVIASDQAGNTGYGSAAFEIERKEAEETVNTLSLNAVPAAGRDIDGLYVSSSTVSGSLHPAAAQSPPTEVDESEPFEPALLLLPVLAGILIVRRFKASIHNHRKSELI